MYVGFPGFISTAVCAATPSFGVRATNFPVVSRGAYIRLESPLSSQAMKFDKIETR